MRFTPQSAEDIAKKTKPLTGIFPATVHSAEACVSKKGVDMIKLNVTVYVNTSTFEKTTYLHPAMEVLVYNFCKHAGLEEEYHTGSLTADMCERKDVFVKLGIEKGKDGYADKSVIRDFVSQEEHDKAAEKRAGGAPTQAERKPPTTPPRPPVDPDLDVQPDDIPF